jgi:hypothetical protein
VKGILADVNIQGYVDMLVVRMRSEPWKLFWDHLRLQYARFTELGLAPDSLDSEAVRKGDCPPEIQRGQSRMALPLQL